ncbi:Alpha/beta hydrolase fold-1 [Xylaria palmicola]|nr:Alpha/beta hydrolase fold-1 [Xylaria palmicola]
MEVRGVSKRLIAWPFSRLYKSLRRASHLSQIGTAPSSTKPVIILISGAWHLPDSWDEVKLRLEKAGYEVYAPRLLTVVGQEPVNHSWRVDVAVVHDVAVPLFNQGRRVVLVGHSYGGLVATAAVENQSLADRRSRGLLGGFSAVVHICSFPISQRGSSLFSAVGGDYSSRVWLTAAEPFKNVPRSLEVVPDRAPFYNDLPPDMAKELGAKLQHQSQRSFEEPLEFCANDIRIPMTYLLCENDRTIPIDSQEFIVRSIPAMKTRRCTSGHSPFLSQPDLTADVIIEATRSA